MKIKDFNKKLTLKKTTIAHLKDTDMQAVNGGATNPSNNPHVCCIPKTELVLCDTTTISF